MKAFISYHGGVLIILEDSLKKQIELSFQEYKEHLGFVFDDPQPSPPNYSSFSKQGFVLLITTQVYVSECLDFPRVSASYTPAFLMAIFILLVISRL